MRPAIIVLAVVMLLLCYASTLRGMADQWWNDEDMGHGVVVPLVVFWIVWRERSRWQALPMQPSWLGLALLAAGAVIHIAAAMGAGLFAHSVAFLISVLGVVLAWGGFALLRAWAFPFLLTLFMLPKLVILYNQFTLPLQLLASRMAAGMLSAAGMHVIREGNILNVAGHQIEVAQACSGLRYVIPLGFTALLLGYLSGSKPWVRMVLLVAAVPVAIAANALRVAAAGGLPALSVGTLHAASGWAIFFLCLPALVFVQRLAEAIYARRHA